MSRLVLLASALTVEYDIYQGEMGILLVPFPSQPESDDVLIIGTPDELDAVVDGMSRLIDDLKE